ncbi:MAG TPA: DUF6249 domain-containing protein [Pseudomonadales bacterium]|nr:DUF6249 domain-containing protein [Pseudomonadales bacterium]
MKHLLSATLIGTLMVSGWALAQNETPPPPVERPADAAQMIGEDHVKISGDENSVRINVQEADGKKVNITVDLDESVPGVIAKRVVERLKEKGVIQGDNWQIEAENLEELKNLEGLEALEALEELEQLEKLDRNISFSIETDLDEDNGHNRSGFWVLVPILGILAVFGTPVLIVYLIVRATTRRRELMHENINKLLEQGKDIPPELLQAFQRQASPESDLYRGIRLSLVGVAIIIALSMLADFEVGSLGFIPLAIGLAQVITWKIQQNKQQSNQTV